MTARFIAAILSRSNLKTKDKKICTILVVDVDGQFSLSGEAICDEKNTERTNKQNLERRESITDVLDYSLHNPNATLTNNRIEVGRLHHDR